jgi:hypothetical protein
VHIKCLDTWHHFMWVGRNFIQTGLEKILSFELYADPEFSLIRSSSNVFSYLSPFYLAANWQLSFHDSDSNPCPIFTSLPHSRLFSG